MSSVVSETSLETRLAARLGQPGFISCRSGHEAFLALLLALELQPDDEVVLAVSICQTMINAVLIVGALPVLIDCDAELGLSSDELPRWLRKRTRVVVAHHPHGASARLDRIRALTRAAGVLLVEDCAQAAGANLGGSPVGGSGDVALYSFARDKPLSAGVGGGLSVRDDPPLAARVRAAARVSATSSDDALGLDLRLRPNERERVAAALARFDNALDERRAKARIMLQALHGWSDLVHRVPLVDEHDWVRHRVVIRVRDTGEHGTLGEVVAGLGSPSIVQTAVPIAPHRRPHLNRRYRSRGYEWLCDERGIRFPTYTAVERSYLWLRTSAWFSSDALLEAAESLRNACCARGLSLT